jgi:hypothetical protein
MATTINFTPTEELILDVLQARIRLGENIWNFDSRLKPSIEKLQAKGLVNFKGGNVENTLLAWPTDEGKILLFDGKFTDRVGSKKLAKRQEELRKEAKALKKKLKKSNG